MSATIKIKLLIFALLSLFSTSSQAIELQDAVAKLESISYISDSELYSTTEYWASPLETKKLKLGDCEDIAIYRFFKLKKEGLPSEKLRLSLGKLNGKPHVLVIYSESKFQVKNDAIAIDSYSMDTYFLHLNKDYKELFSFDETTIYAGKKSYSASLMNSWATVLEKIKSDPNQLKFL